MSNYNLTTHIDSITCNLLGQVQYCFTHLSGVVGITNVGVGDAEGLPHTQMSRSVQMLVGPPWLPRPHSVEEEAGFKRREPALFGGGHQGRILVLDVHGQMVCQMSQCGRLLTPVR